MLLDRMSNKPFGLLTYMVFLSCKMILYQCFLLMVMIVNLWKYYISKLVPFFSQVFTDAFMFKDSVQNGASISTPISCCYAIMSTPHLSASMVAKFESYVSKPIFLSPSTKFHEVSCYINHWISSYVQKFMLAITQIGENSSELSIPWTFPWFDKILSNLPFLLLRAFLDKKMDFYNLTM